MPTKEQIVEFKRSNPTWSHRAIASALGASKSHVGSVLKGWATPATRPGPILEHHRKPAFDKLPERKVDVLDMLRKAAERVDGHKKDSKDYHRIVIDTDKPIAVMKAADLHFGGLDVDYKSWLKHVQFLLDTPGLYLQLFGDDLNMMIMHRSVSARHDCWTPDEQVAWLESFVDEMKQRGKLLSMCWGNHSDEWTEKNAGFGIVRMLTQHKIPYFRGMGYIDLQVGEQTYPMAFTHKSRFSSFMNPVHGSKRMEQMHPHFFGMRPVAREYITAHTHDPAYMCEGCTPEDRIWLIKCGTFKTDCMYSQRYFGQGKIGVPTVVYSPDRMSHMCFPTPWDAVRYMHGPACE